MAKAKTPVYAIIRIDDFHDSTVTIEDNITVKEVVLTLEEAEAEVARLNQLNGSKACRYFFQTTRLIEVDE